ncbi:MAG: transposase [Patescibacteria group bacterium]
MECSISHAPKGTTFVIINKVSELDGKTSTEVLRFRIGKDMLRVPKANAKKKDKLAFVATLKPGDRVFMEMGGAGDRVALAATAFGAQVFRVPNFQLGREDVAKICAQYSAEVKMERAHGDETSEELTQRKARAMALLLLGEHEPGRFYATENRDVSVLQIGYEYRAYRRMQKSYQRALLGLMAAYRDMAFIVIAKQRQTLAKALDDKAVYNEVLDMAVRDMLGGDISETDIKDFKALVGQKFGDAIPNLASKEGMKIFVQVLMDSDPTSATAIRRMKEQAKKIKKLLEPGKVRVPGTKKFEAVPGHFLYEQVFSKIPGIGHITAARFIRQISDIRSFKDAGHLKAFAGYHQFPDGSRARRVKGKASNWSPDLKQAVYQFTVATVKLPDSPWRFKLDCRKAYELWKLLRERQEEALKLGVTAVIMPTEYATKVVNCAYDFAPTDYLKLGDHVQSLRKLAGMDAKDDEEEDEKSEDDEEEDEEETVVVKDPVLGKLIKGLKGRAHQRGLRWLGQQLLVHVFWEWRVAIGLSGRPQHQAAGMSPTYRAE